MIIDLNNRRHCARIVNVFAVVVTVFFVSWAHAGGVDYDPNTGSYYYWFDAPGGTDIYGVNPTTGSTWNAHSFSDGTMTGSDANNNPWIYDPRTTLYTNQGTNEVCYGLGDLRECF